MNALLSFFTNRIHSNAYALLILCTLFWGGNTIAGRLAIDQVSPLSVVSLRWLIVSGVMLFFYGRQVRQEWHLLRPHLLKMVLMATLGFTCFNSLFYIAAYQTTAINIGIIQGSVPVLVLLGAMLLFRERVHLLQAIGIILTLLGVTLVATRGHLSTLLELSINPGDGFILIACVCYGIYTLALRSKPNVSAMVFFTVLSCIGAITALPALAYEIATGAAYWPTPKGWLIVLYISFFPSLISQVFFMRGVELIGPARAGVFINFVPIFAPILAVLLLNETFHFYHAIALAMVLAGIWLSERKKRTTKQ
ncbi:DMT family transporter [Marinomonas foliarum]|uniref:DMT family transporter n=1 Tax=Marinomonas foliarum TaxID=491950 RepID=A0ABX7ING4_9GAMM|nr:DMT family transporter [Marinomonas foliarum]QRV23785.1 DMT family transporter [Marinomonas foliarum]